MSMKLYVGNLGYQISNDGLEQLFAQAGTIESARVVTTIAGNPRGFDFVAMSSREEGAAAIAQFNGREINGRRLVVNEEEPRGDEVGAELSDWLRAEVEVRELLSRPQEVT